jgi:hypothetical protein
MAILDDLTSRWRRDAFACALSFCLLRLLSSTQAVLFDPLTIEALTAQADVVLHGTILSRTCQRDGAGRIFTRVEVAVSEVWKGAIASTPMQIVHGGGVLGEEQSTVSGQVEYAVGEEIVAFLVRNSRGEAVTLGLKQGKFHVSTDQRGVKLVASPFHGGVEASVSAAQSRFGGAAIAGALELTQLRKRVQEARR